MSYCYLCNPDYTVKMKRQYCVDCTEMMRLARHFQKGRAAPSDDLDPDTDFLISLSEVQRTVGPGCKPVGRQNITVVGAAKRRVVDKGDEEWLRMVQAEMGLTGVA